MLHDFHRKHGGNGGPCDGKGIMSYGSAPMEWSRCSVSDWEKEYSRKKWGKRCLEDISGMFPYQNYFDVHIIHSFITQVCSKILT